MGSSSDILSSISFFFLLSCSTSLAPSFPSGHLRAGSILLSRCNAAPRRREAWDAAGGPAWCGGGPSGRGCLLCHCQAYREAGAQGVAAGGAQGEARPPLLLQSPASRPIQPRVLRVRSAGGPGPQPRCFRVQILVESRCRSLSKIILFFF